MGDKSQIEWTDATWNPVSGCTKISAGCKHCYAKAVFHRPYGGRCVCGHKDEAHDWNDYSVPGRAGDPWGCFHEGCSCQRFRQRQFEDIQLHPNRLTTPLGWKVPREIFVNSMSDLFHEQVSFDYIDQVLGVTQAASHHIYQILTKRHERMLEYFTSSIEGMPGINRDVFVEGQAQSAYFEKTGDRSVDEWLAVHFPLKNVVLGVSVEDQPNADSRIPIVVELARRGWITMLSVEPLLGPVVLPTDLLLLGKRTWVIVGGESGHGARWMRQDWVTSLRDQCVDAGVPFFFKQWGGEHKIVNGRELEGRTWDEKPY